MKKITILHGWTYSLDRWSEFINLLKKSGYEATTLEIPGLTSQSDEVWDVEKYSDWLKRKIGNSKVILLGHSNGGRIALYFANKYPNSIDKLILIDSAGIYHKEMALQIKRFVFGAAAKIGRKLTSSSGLKKFLYKLAREKDYSEATPNMKKSMINLINHDLTPDLPNVKTKTLIIWGKEDRVTPLSDGLLMNKLIKNSDLEIIEDARHSPFYTHPKEVVSIIKKHNI